MIAEGRSSHVKKGFVASAAGDGVEPMSWSKLLKRVFKLAISRCPTCGSKLPLENREVVTSPCNVSRIDYERLTQQAQAA